MAHHLGRHERGEGGREDGEQHDAHRQREGMLRIQVTSISVLNSASHSASAVGSQNTRHWIATTVAQITTDAALANDESGRMR